MLKISNLLHKPKTLIQGATSFPETIPLEALERIIVKHRANTGSLRGPASGFDRALSYIENEAC